MKRHLLPATTLLSCSLLLTACGGGSGSSSDPDQPGSGSSDNSAPVAGNVTLTDNNGNAVRAGDELTVTYAYSDQENDAEGVSRIRWLADGTEITSGTERYVIQEADEGKSITAEITPVAATGTAEGTAVVSNALTVVINQPPEAINAGIIDVNAGTLLTRDELQVLYNYSDADRDPEGETLIRWFVDGNEVATGRSYISSPEDTGKIITAEVTPIAKTGRAAGTTVTTDNRVSPAKRNLRFFNATNADNRQATYVTDGTSAGTYLLSDANNLTSVARLNDQYVLSVVQGNGYRTLAFTDGSSDNVTILPITSATSARFNRTNQLVSLNGKAYFSGFDTTNNIELWSTDGTEAGTGLFNNILTNPSGSDPKNFRTVGNHVYFSAYQQQYGPELWRTDGTTEGTVMVKDFNSGSFGSSPYSLNEFGNKIIFNGREGSPVAGTLKNVTYIYSPDTNTSAVLNLDNLFNYQNFLALDDGKAFISGGRSFNTIHSWITDGTVAGTSSITSVSTNFNMFNPVQYKGDVYVIIGTQVQKLNINTKRFEAVLPDFTSVTNMAVLGEYLILSATEEENGDRELYRFDGNEVTQIKNIMTNGSSNPDNFFLLNDQMTFTATSEENGRELWATDGTEKGTFLLKDINPGDPGSNPAFCHLTGCLE